MILDLIVEWPNSPEEAQFLRTQYATSNIQTEVKDEGELKSKANLRRYSFFKEKLTNMIIIFIIGGILEITSNPIFITGSWRPVTFGNAMFDIIVIVEIVIFLLLFYICYLIFGTYTTITIDDKHVALYGPSFPKFTFDDVSFFEVRPARSGGENGSNPINHIISIHLRSGKRIRLRTPPTLFFDSSRTIMEKDLLETIKAPVRIYKSNKSV